jgi:tetratricopeptide (TPR) repeat protein
MKFPVLLAFIFFMIYIPTYKTPFIMDDSHTIQQNQFVHSLKYLATPWLSAKAYSSSPENYGYRPLTTNFSQLMWAVGGGSVIPFQVAKKLLLLLVAGLCFLMWKEWKLCVGEKKSKSLWWGPTALGFAFFLLHPIGTQVGNYIAATSTLLCSLFYVLGFYFYLKFRRLGHRRFLFLAGLAYFLSVMCKEEGSTLIAVVALAEIFFFRKSKQLLSFKISDFAVLTAVALFSVYLIVSHFEPSSNIARGSVPRDLYFATQWRAYFYYLANFFWPFNFNFDNLDFQFAHTLWNFENIFYFFLNAFLVGYAGYLCYRKNSMGFAMLGFYISILPASSVIPLAEAVNDHRPFIPFLFFGYAMVTALDKYAPKAVAGLVILTLAGATLYRNFDFISNKTIWVDTVLKNPNSPRAKNNLALEYMSTADYNMAFLLLKKCAEQNIYYYPCFINLAITKAASGDDQGAEENFKKAVVMDKNYISSRMFYADFLVRKQRYSEAKTLLQEADGFASGLNKPISDRLAAVNSQLVKQ